MPSLFSVSTPAKSLINQSFPFSSSSFYSDLVSYMTSGPVFAIELSRTSAVAAWREMLGPTNPEKERSVSDFSIYTVILMN